MASTYSQLKIRLAMPPQGAGINPHHRLFYCAHMLAQPPRLLMAQIRQTVIALFISRRRIGLPMPDKGDRAHTALRRSPSATKGASSPQAEARVFLFFKYPRRRHPPAPEGPRWRFQRYVNTARTASAVCITSLKESNKSMRETSSDTL